MSSIKKRLKENIVFYKLQQFFMENFNVSIGKGNSRTNNGLCYKVRYNIIGNNNTITIAKGVKLSNVVIFIRGNNHSLVLEEKVAMRGGELWFEDSDCEIRVKKNTTIESAHIAVTEQRKKIVIGEDCMLSTNIQIRSGDSHSILVAGTRERINPAENVTIGNRVWIGANAVILKGSDIADNSIVGTGSIVSGSVAPNTLVAGIPAKELKNNVDWIRERI